jgi:hypothetical protein
MGSYRHSFESVRRFVILLVEVPMTFALTHGISHSAVFVSVWAVVGAINAHPKLQIDYPRCHTKREKEDS